MLLRRSNTSPARDWLLPAMLAAALLATGGRAQEPPAEESLARRAPLPPPAFLSHCLRLIERGGQERARTLLEPVVADHPGWARAHFYLALTYQKQKRYAPACELYERTLQLDPEYHTARAFYGWCLYYLGELKASREMFESFLAVKPGYPDAIFALGLIDYDEDEIDAARTRFTEAIRLAREKQDRSTESKSRARLADVHVRSGRLDEAREELQRSIELNPDNYETYFKLSRVLERLGDGQGAAAARRKHQKVRERVRPGASGRTPEDP